MHEIKRRIKQFKTQEKFEKDKMNETGQSTANPAVATSRIDDKESKMATAKDANQLGKPTVGGESQDKKKVFLNVISDIEQSFLINQKPKSPYDYIDKKLQKI